MTAQVQLWGRTIGAVSMMEDRDYAAFQYDPAFAKSGVELSPLSLPLSDQIYVFPELARKTFHGLPGLLADSLPDKFGNALINAWLATQGRTPESFGAVERLCYTGTRGMGALEFVPGLGPCPRKAAKIRKAVPEMREDRFTGQARSRAGEVVERFVRIVPVGEEIVGVFEGHAGADLAE